jgi:hypothetical protein
MAARLECDVKRGAAGAVAGRFQCFYLGVWAAEFLMVAFTDNFAIDHHNRADNGIGVHTPPAVFGQPQRGVDVSYVNAVLSIHRS